MGRCSLGTWSTTFGICFIEPPVERLFCNQEYRLCHSWTFEFESATSVKNTATSIPGRNPEWMSILPAMLVIEAIAFIAFVDFFILSCFNATLLR